MALTPLDVTTKEKIITLHLAGLGRNEICRQFQKEGLSVSSGSISNVIKRYKLEHEPPLQSQYQQTSSKSKMVDNSDDSSIPELAIPNPESRVEALSHPSVEAEVNIESADIITDNVVKEDETISREKEKFKQYYKPSSSGFKDSSRYPHIQNREDQDQDQEDEQNIDLGINWALEEEENRKRSFKEESKQHQSRYTSYLKPTNLGIDYDSQRPRPTIGIDLDSDEKWESNFWARVMGEKEERRRELQTMEQQWQAIGEERQENAQMREWLEEQKSNLKNREAKVAEVESLAPSVRQLQQMNISFYMIQSYILLVNERAVLGNIDTRKAALSLSHEFKEFRSLGNILKAKLEAERKLAELNMLITQKQTALKILTNLQAAGFSEDQIAQLTRIVNTWNALSCITGLSHNNGYYKFVEQDSTIEKPVSVPGLMG